jgi:hypothetical protein
MLSSDQSFARRQKLQDDMQKPPPSSAVWLDLPQKIHKIKKQLLIPFNVYIIKIGLKDLPKIGCNKIFKNGCKKLLHIGSLFQTNKGLPRRRTLR